MFLTVDLSHRLLTYYSLTHPSFQPFYKFTSGALGKLLPFSGHDELESDSLKVYASNQFKQVEPEITSNKASYCSVRNRRVCCLQGAC